jgi:hypothetical protein
MSDEIEDEGMDPESRGGRVDIKIPEDLAGGVYANNMVVTHTREEFVLDFLALFHPRRGVVTARVVLSPGHLKRVVRALEENLARYEERFGKLEEAPSPDGDKVH